MDTLVNHTKFLIEKYFTSSTKICGCEIISIMYMLLCNLEPWSVRIVCTSAVNVL